LDFSTSLHGLVPKGVNLGKFLKDDGTWDTPAGGNGGYTEGARVYHNVDQVIPDDTWTYVAFNSERWDTDGCHSNVTNNSRLICKTAGKYLFVVSVYMEPGITGMQRLTMIVNRTTYICVFSLPASALYFQTSQVAVWDMAVNDFCEVQVLQQSGGEIDLKAASAYSPEFTMQRIG